MDYADDSAMATDLYSSFNEQYNNVAAKLKKRFLRKPNIQDVLNEFLTLANQCIDSEQPAIAGQTYVMAAKCENTMGNMLGEAECLLNAARLFMKEDMKMVSIKCCSPARENLEAAIGCYMQAMTKYPEDSPLRTGIYLELADALSSMGAFAESVPFYQQAIDSFSTDHAIKLKYLRKLMDVHIHTNNHPAALDICYRVCEFEGASKTSAIVKEVVINSIFLVLLVEPPEEKIPQILRKIFTNLEEENIDLKMDAFDQNLCTKMESVLISYSAGDRSALVYLFSQCTTYLTLLQRELLQRLITKLQNAVIYFD